MKGIVFPGNRELELMEFPDPTPGSGEVLLEIKASGMCGSDLHFYRAAEGGKSLGIMTDGNPIIAGHEPCGVVVARDPGLPDKIAPEGARVMVHHYSGCGFCSDCRSGWQQLCSSGMVVYGATAHGAHAPYMAVAADTLVPLPESLSYSEGAAISCGTTTAYSALKRMNLTGRETLSVFGQGPVGLSAVMFARELGARVVAIDISHERLALAKEFGAHEMINASESDPIESIKELTNGRGAAMSIECSGVPEVRAQSVRSTGTWGTVCFVGEGGSVTLDVSKDILRKQLTIMGSWTFSSFGQAECAQYIADRGIDLDRIFTHRFVLSEAQEAYALFDQQTTGKGVFEF
jgi:threonine dehydrogenase-like Zn-dependent dehydrogenase